MRRNGKPRDHSRDSSGQTRVGSLDMADPKDRRMLILSVGRNWKITPQRMGLFLKALENALLQSEANDDAQGIVNCVNAFTRIVGQVQSDEQLEYKDAAGMADNTVDIRITRE